MPREKKPYRSEIDPSKAKITHIMADGSVRDSVKGYLTSADQLPPVVRGIIRDIMLAPDPPEKKQA